MRKRQKQAIESMIQTLFEAHDEIKKAAEGGRPEQAMDLLGQCQEAAIQVGTKIEESEGEGFPAIGLLEQYCEQLYRFHQELSQGQAISVNKVYKNLRKQLIQIETSIKHNISATIEAVFMPYKAAMWDSLESVWQAAAEDESCDAYVVPIPYYDRNPDRSFGDLHYEGDLLPEYVPTTHYEDYNLAERRPDVIFIHNPYDDKNLVTSVHPAFYSEQLKTCTEQLVYIPYFVWGKISADNQGDVDRIKHFCTTPGVVNADTVIVQSEAMRQVYINILTEQAGEHTRMHWEGRIQGIGSPKLDKIYIECKREHPIPAEWMKLIYRPDGSRKTIILYNTSVSSLLEQSNKMLKKMKDIFCIFRKRTDEYTFWWRPHPLMRATISAMRPELWKEYQEIVEEYCREGWGIYDDSPDVDRAVVISDVYYGDPSTVIELYKQTGKPALIQEVDVNTICQEKEAMITFSACGLWKKRLYFFANRDGLFSEMDLETGKVRFLEDLFHYPCTAIDAVDRMYVKGNRLYALENGGERLVVIDLEQRKHYFVNMGCHQNGWGNYAGMMEYGSYLYIFPRYKNKIVRVHMNTLEKTEFTADRELKGMVSGKPIFDYVWCCDNKAILISWTNDRLIKFHLPEERLQKRSLPNDMKNCIPLDAVWFHSKFWVLTEQGNVKKFNEDLELEHVFYISDKYDIKAPDMGKLEVAENRLFLFPSMGADIFTIDLKKEKTEPFRDYPEDFQYLMDRKWPKYSTGCKDGDNIYYPMRCMNYILKVNIQNGETSWIKPVNPGVEERLECYFRNNEAVFLEENIPIQILLNNLKRKMPLDEDHPCNSGERIWKFLKNSRL